MSNKPKGKEIDLLPGPCIGCGDTNYGLSTSGPDVCIQCAINGPPKEKVMSELEKALDGIEQVTFHKSGGVVTLDPIGFAQWADRVAKEAVRAELEWWSTYGVSQSDPVYEALRSRIQELSEENK